MAAEYSSNAIQTIASNASAIFTEAPVPCNRGLIYHRDESGIFRLASPRLINGWTRNRCCCCNKMPRARYIVNFGGNIQVPTGGTVEAISMAIAIDGEIDPSSIMTFTPAAVEQLGNISAQVIVEVPAICMCASVSVRNVSAQDIQLQNANMTIVFDGVHQ